jgi:hypothetical protein
VCKALGEELGPGSHGQRSGGPLGERREKREGGKDKKGGWETADDHEFKGLREQEATEYERERRKGREKERQRQRATATERDRDRTDAQPVCVRYRA